MSDTPKRAKDAPFVEVSPERLRALIDIHFGDYLNGAGFEACMAFRELATARARIQKLGRVPPLFDLSYMERHGGHYIRVEDHRLSLAEIQRLNGELSAAQAKLAGVGTTHQIVPVEPTDAIRKAMRDFFVWQSMPDLWGEVWKAALTAAKEEECPSNQ